MKIELSNNNTLLVKAPYEKHDLIKTIGSYRWDKKRKVWIFPANKIIALFENLNLTFTPAIKKLYDDYRNKEKERKKKISYIKSLYGKKWPSTGLRRHQNIGLEAAKQFPAYCLFMECGTGKTLVAIKLIEFRKARTLVVGPLSILESVWVEEVNKFAPHLKVINLWNKLKRIEEPADIYLINYEQFKKIKDFSFVDFMIIDESSKLKAPSTQITKAVLKTNIKYRLILSGTPAPNSTLEFWGQLAFINPDLLGDNFYRFRSIYFTSVGYGGFQWVISKANREKIMNKIKEQAIFFAKKDCLDLPEQVFEKKSVVMSDSQTRVYKQMFNDNIAFFKNKVTLGPIELTKMMKLREITSGFFFDEDNKAVAVSDKKLNVLDETLEEIGSAQVTIFCNFQWEIKAIKERLGEKAVVIDGHVSQREKESSIKLFQMGYAQYLIANVTSAAHGLNLQNCHYCVYYSLSYSNEMHRQSQDRFHRSGQKNKVTYFYLLCKDTIDETLYKVLVKKANLLESCLEMLKG